jgi:hypothetical protein
MDESLNQPGCQKGRGDQTVEYVLRQGGYGAWACDTNVQEMLGMGSAHEVRWVVEYAVQRGADGVSGGIYVGVFDELLDGVRFVR